MYQPRNNYQTPLMARPGVRQWETIKGCLFSLNTKTHKSVYSRKKEQYLNAYLYNWKFCGGPSLEENGSSDAKDDPLPPKPDKGIDWTVDIAVAVKGLILRDVRYVTPSKAPPCNPITWNIIAITLDRRLSAAELILMDRKFSVSISMVKQRCIQKVRSERKKLNQANTYVSITLLMINATTAWYDHMKAQLVSNDTSMMTQV